MTVLSDLCSGEIVGYAMTERIHHTDRGSQYCVHECRRLLEKFGMEPSMRRKGNCYHHAPIDGFRGTLKMSLFIIAGLQHGSRQRMTCRNTPRSFTIVNVRKLGSAIWLPQYSVSSTIANNWLLNAVGIYFFRPTSAG